MILTLCWRSMMWAGSTRQTTSWLVSSQRQPINLNSILILLLATKIKESKINFLLNSKKYRTLFSKKKSHQKMTRTSLTTWVMRLSANSEMATDLHGPSSKRSKRLLEQTKSPNCLCSRKLKVAWWKNKKNSNLTKKPPRGGIVPYSHRGKLPW